MRFTIALLLACALAACNRPAADATAPAGATAAATDTEATPPEPAVDTANCAFCADPGVVRTCDVAEPALSTQRPAGPNAASSCRGVASRQAVTSPRYGSRVFREVLPSGVRQHAAYHRSVPFGLSDMQATCSTPAVSRTAAGAVGTMSVPPASSRTSGCPRNRA